MELNRDYESAAIYKWRKKRKKAFVLFICIVGICFLVTIEEATKNLDPTDIQGLQRLMNEKRKMQDLRTLHISIN